MKPRAATDPTAAFQAQHEPRLPAESGKEYRFVGCTASESAFSSDRVYQGGAAGASFELAREHARGNNKRYFAVSKLGSEGHVFAFNALVKPVGKGVEGGCDQPCEDDAEKFCGCIDSACTEGRDGGRRGAKMRPRERSSIGDGPCMSECAMRRPRGRDAREGTRGRSRVLGCVLCLLEIEWKGRIVFCWNWLCREKMNPENTKIGFVGIGVMGKSMCRNLMKNGYKATIVGICNRLDFSIIALPRNARSWLLKERWL